MVNAGIACPISGPVVSAAWATNTVAAKARIRFRAIRFAALYRAAANPAAKHLEREMSIQLMSSCGLAIFPGVREYFTHPASHDNGIIPAPLGMKHLKTESKEQNMERLKGKNILITGASS